jgi:hypothetical protein
MRLRTLAIGAAALFAAIQLVPVERTNPPVSAPVPMPKDVETALRRACFDCHSHETRWPWYARVAPASWKVARDVREARAHLNFSTFDDTGSREKIERWKATWKQVDEGRMAPWYYTPVHERAELTDTERRRVRIWALGSANEESYRSQETAPSE